MPYRLLLLHGGAYGENSGVYVQHVETMRWLFDGDPEWSVAAMDSLHPALSEAALTSDVVVVGMSAAPEVESLIRLRRARGLRTVFELTDNYLGLGSWVTPHNLLHSPLARQNIVFHAHLADAIQVYARPLAELFRSVNERIVVFDPYVPAAAALPGEADGFVFGWGGTRSHRDDLTPLAPAIAELCARHRDAVFSFMGDAALFEELFSAIAPEQKRWRAYGAYDDYLDFVRELHVGLAPLSPTPFNAARSDTKVVTYAACGAVAVAQDAPVYRPHASRARLFANGDDLLAQLEALHADRGAWRALRHAAHAWVLAERGRDALHGQRARFYRSLVGDVECGGHAAAVDTGLAERLAEASGKAPAEALAICLEVLRDDAAYPQAQWLYLRLLESMGRDADALAFADSVTPAPLFADLFAEAQTRLARKLRPHDARRYEERVASPARRARLAHARGGDPLAYYRAVLEQQPYDFFALSVVIRLLAKHEPESSELAPLFARAALVAPSLVPADRRPAELEPFLPQ